MSAAAAPSLVAPACFVSLKGHFSHSTDSKDNAGTTHIAFQTHSFSSPSLSQTSDVSSVACKAHCTILWSIEANIADGVVYVTGGPVSLGCWDPHQAIPFSRSLHTSNLWETQIEVPWGINFKYNYIIRHTSSVIEWRPGPEYSLSVPVSTGGDDFIRVRDCWMRESIHRFPLPSWGSWLLDSGFTIDLLTHPAQQDLSPGEQNILENKNGTTRKDDQSIIQINGHDCIENSNSKLQREKYGLIEEPWLIDFKYAKLYSLLEEQTEAVASHPPREVEVGSTVILVNSSACTMQRIAVLEEGKLVELLLESEKKDKVQKDDIYLGVITELVPCSKQAFVDIGMKQGFMEIKQSIKPFVYTTSKNDEEREEDLEVADFVCEALQGGNNKKRNQWVNVKKGTKIMVQVKKEELPKKGPKLTPYPNLSSRFLVLGTEKDKVGVSRKISGSEKTHLKLIAKNLKPPPGIGLVLRTAAAGHSLEELQKDLDGLLSTWKEIAERARSAARAADEGVEGAVPVLLHGAMPQALSVVQDLFNDKVKSMVIDSPRTYHEVMSYLQENAPELCERVELYDKRTPIFDEYKIEEEINGILSKRVDLSNGGYLVIEQTEALVSIDVNAGSSVFGEGDTAERAALDVNILAAKQIARELRLRDLGGIIVVDFINMSDKSSIRKVFEEMTKAVKRDRSKVKVYEFSDHGLMEISRKRVRPSVPFMISQPCICCPGTGRVEALEMSFMKIENQIRRASSNHRPVPENPKTWPELKLQVDKHMYSYLTSGNSIKLAVLSVSLHVCISLKRVDAFPRGKFEIIDISALRVLDRTKNSSVPFHKKNLRRHGHFPNKNLRSRGHFRIKKLKSSAT
ncbi:ribonuclease E/G-like protein, chloroplastic [Carex rostrata]